MKTLTQIPSSAAWMQVANLAALGMGPSAQMQAAIGQAMSFKETSPVVADAFATQSLLKMKPIAIFNHALLAATDAIETDVAAGRFAGEREFFGRMFVKRTSEFMSAWDAVGLESFRMYCIPKPAHRYSTERTLKYFLATELSKQTPLGDMPRDVADEYLFADPERIVGAREELALLQKALDGLSPLELDVLLKTNLDGMTSSEIAEDYGRVASSARMALARARTKLAEAWEKKDEIPVGAFGRFHAKKIEAEKAKLAAQLAHKRQLIEKMFESKFMSVTFKPNLNGRMRIAAVEMFLKEGMPQNFDLIVEAARAFSKNLGARSAQLKLRRQRQRVRADEKSLEIVRKARAEHERRIAEGDRPMPNVAELFRHMEAARQKRIDDEYKRFKIKQEKWQRENGLLKD